MRGKRYKRYECLAEEEGIFVLPTVLSEQMEEKTRKKNKNK